MKHTEEGAWWEISIAKPVLSRATGAKGGHEAKVKEGGPSG